MMGPPGMNPDDNVIRVSLKITQIKIYILLRKSASLLSEMSSRIWNSLNNEMVRLVFVVILVFLVLLVPLAEMVILVLLVQLVHKVLPVLLVRLVHKVLRVARVQKVKR